MRTNLNRTQRIISMPAGEDPVAYFSKCREDRIRTFAPNGNRSQIIKSESKVGSATNFPVLDINPIS